MNLIQALVAIAFNSISTRQGAVHWKTVQAWVNSNSDPGRLGQGYASFNSRIGYVNQPYVELRRRNSTKGVTVTATVYFDKKQGPSISQSWEGGKLDGELDRMFGKNLRTTIRI